MRMAKDHFLDSVDYLDSFDFEEQQINDSQAREPSNGLESDLGDEEEGEKHCFACKRGSLTGRSISQPDERLGWRNAGAGVRGNLCQECFRTWSLSFQNHSTLTQLPVYLAGPENHARFILHELAYASLKREGKQRVTGLGVEERVQLIDWLLQHMGLPSAPFRVATLNSEDEMPKGPAQFCTIIDNGRERLGVFKPLEPHELHRKSLPRPAGDLPMYLGHSILLTDVDWERDALMSAGHAGDVLAILDDDARSMTSSAACENPVSPQKHKVKKWALAMEQKLLAAFSKPTWTKLIRESQFRPFLTKLGSLKQELAMVGNDDALLQYVNNLEKGLISGKGFMRAHRNFSKATKISISRCLALEPYLGVFVAFVDEHTFVKVCSEIRILRAKNVFLERFVESNSLSDAFDKFVNLGVLDLLASEECIDPPSTWFRKLVFMCIAHAMEQAKNHTKKVDFFSTVGP